MIESILKRNKMKKVESKECSDDERYSELRFSFKMPEDFTIERGRKIYRNIWDIKEFDSGKEHRHTLVSADCNQPLSEAFFFTRSRYHSQA